MDAVRPVVQDLVGRGAVAVGVAQVAPRVLRLPEGGSAVRVVTAGNGLEPVAPPDALELPLVS